jgi:signal transduction histidine kinase/ActR/RegA family two-component response regulator
VLWFTTRYGIEHPILYFSAFTSVAISAIVRVLLHIFRERLVDSQPGLFVALLWFAVGCTAVANSLLYVSSLLFYGFEDWTFTVMLIWTVGGVSGSTISFTPTLRLLFCYVIVLLAPALCAGLWIGGTRGHTYSFGTGVLIAFLLIQGLILNRAYWRQLHSRAAEADRLQEVEAARAAAESANRAKSTFLANMSHEIRTPMHGILGMAQVALNSPMPPQSREYLEVIQSTGQGLLHVLNDVLDFSKMEAGKLELEQAPFSLAKLLDEVHLIVTPQARFKGLAVDWQVGTGIPATVVGDQVRLRQVLLNLLSNALKFTSEGSVGLRVESLPGASPDAETSLVAFHIIDTGIGISHAAQQQLFQPFSQADSSVTRNYGGTGLGLAISSQITCLLGGKLELESAPGRGCTFSFTVPLKVTELATDSTPAPVRQPLFDTFPSLRVLVGEDNPVNQRVIYALLAKAGVAHTTVAATGTAVLAAWEAAEYDIILIDNQMPEMGGIETVRQIRLREAELARRRTPAIIVTASAMAGDRESFLQAGLDGYLAKPFRSSELETSIHDVLAAAPESAIARTYSSR